MKNGDRAVSRNPCLSLSTGYYGNDETKPSSVSVGCVRGGDGGSTDNFLFRRKQQEAKANPPFYLFSAYHHPSFSSPFIRPLSSFYTFTALLFAFCSPMFVCVLAGPSFSINFFLPPSLNPRTYTPSPAAASPGWPIGSEVGVPMAT